MKQLVLIGQLRQNNGLLGASMKRRQVSMFAWLFDRHCLRIWSTSYTIFFDNNFDNYFDNRLLLLSYLTLPNLTGKWSYVLHLLTWQGPGKWSYGQVAEGLIQCLLLGLIDFKGAVSGVRASYSEHHFNNEPFHDRTNFHDLNTRQFCHSDPHCNSQNN